MHFYDSTELGNDPYEAIYNDRELYKNFLLIVMIIV